jgi:hypothetical protein
MDAVCLLHAARIHQRWFEVALSAYEVLVFL